MPESNGEVVGGVGGKRRRRPGFDGTFQPPPESRVDRKRPINATGMLKDLRHVYRKQKGEDTTPGHNVLRKLLEESPDKFLAMLKQAEDRHAERLIREEAGFQERKLAEAKGRNKGGGVRADVSGERARALIARLLKEASGG